MEESLDEAWSWLVEQVIEWALGTLRTLVLWWLDETAFSVRMSGEQGTVLYVLREHLNWLIAVGMFIGFMVTVFRMALQRRGEPLKAMMSQFFELLVLVFTLATLVNLGNIAVDEYCHWLLNNPSLVPQDEAWTEDWEQGIKVLGGHEEDTALILFIFASAAMLSTAIQFALMLFRNGVLIILVAVLPVLAAMRYSEAGNRAYRTVRDWIVAWMTFKATAATALGAGMGLMQSEAEPDRLFGLAVVAGSVFALPATLRAINPGLSDNNPHFGIRQVGHFVFGGSALNMAQGKSVLTPSGLKGGGSPGGASGGVPAGGEVPSGPAWAVRSAIQITLGTTRAPAQSSSGDGSSSSPGGADSPPADIPSGADPAPSDPNPVVPPNPTSNVPPPDFSSIGGTKSGTPPPPPPLNNYQGPSGSA